MKDLLTYFLKKQVSVCHSTFCMEIVHAWMCFTKLHTSKELAANTTPFLKTCHFGSTRVVIISRVSFSKVFTNAIYYPSFDDGGLFLNFWGIIQVYLSLYHPRSFPEMTVCLANWHNFSNAGKSTTNDGHIFCLKSNALKEIHMYIDNIV